MFKAFDKNAVPRQKVVKIRLRVGHECVASLAPDDRNKWVSEAVIDFLNWDSYLETDWRDFDKTDANPFLDSVLLSTRPPRRAGGSTLAPVSITLTPHAGAALSKAVSAIRNVVRPSQVRGLRTGIIRSAITHQLLMNGPPGAAVDQGREQSWSNKE